MTRTHSKTFAPGWGDGYVLPGRHQERVLLRKFALNVATGTGPQRAMCRFLEAGAYDRHLRRLRQALAGASEEMGGAASRCFPSGTRVSRPQGGYSLEIELPKDPDSLARS